MGHCLLEQEESGFLAQGKGERSSLYSLQRWSMDMSGSPGPCPADLAVSSNLDCQDTSSGFTKSLVSLATVCKGFMIWSRVIRFKMREGIQKDGCGNHRSVLSSSTASLCYWEFIAGDSEVRFPPLEGEEGVRALAACGVNLPQGCGSSRGCRQVASLCLVGLLVGIDSSDRKHSQMSKGKRSLSRTGWSMEMYVP